jgi:tetratricopeptide (TPR) repeat protein
VAIDREKVLQTAQKFVEKKKYDKAVLEYQKVIQEDPNDARTLLKIGDLQLKMEAFADAIATYERVGRFYASQGFALKAIAVYKQIREIIHKHVPQLEERYAHIAPKLAELYQQLGLTSDALAALDEVATRLQRQGRDPEAIEVFRRIVELDPTNPLPHLRLAEALSRARDPESAAAEFAVAAGQLLKHGRRDDALKVIERLLHHRQDISQARVAAELYLQRGQPNDGMLALAKLQMCFQANPKDLDTLALLSRAFVAIGQASKGVEVQKEMARIARDQGKHDLFRQLVEKLERAAPHDDQVQQLAALARGPSQQPAAHHSSARREPSELNDLDDVELIETGDIEAYELEEVEEAIQAEASAAAAQAADYQQEEDPEAAYAEHSRRVLAKATSLREREQDAAAVEVLRAGLETDPRSLDIRYALRDALIDLGNNDEAVEEMLYIASIQLDTLDGESAARTLQDVLSIDPANLRAIHTLRELGFDVAEPPAESGPIYDQGLPAYDLDEQNAVGRTATDARAANIPANAFGEGPLPSFPLEPESEPFELVHGASEHINATYEGPAPPEASSGSSGGGPNPEVEDALEEADFYASRGLFEDARAVLLEQLGRHPNHPLLNERIAELDSQEHAAQQPSGTRTRPTSEEDRSFAIAASLDALESIDQRTSPGHIPQLAPQGQVDVEEVFQKFKEGVSKQIGADDSQSHYDLGVAYKEMGLYEDAVREFAVAARDKSRTCICETMTGLLHMEHEDVDKAIDAFQRGLAAPVRAPAHETAVSFELAAAYESKGLALEALAQYRRVAEREPNFRDVQDRIRRLSKVEQSSPKMAAAVGDDEFDRAFADIIGPDK